MQIDSSRDSSNENEQVIAYYRATGITVQSASFDAVPEWEKRTTRHVPTDGLYETPFSASRPFGVLMSELGGRIIDWGDD